MKASAIKLGERYAIKIDGTVTSGNVIRPVKNHSGRWVAVLDERPGYATPVAERTVDVSSASILDRWARYCIDTAHAEALTADRIRDDLAEYDAEKRAEAERIAPFIDAFRGIQVAGNSFRHANVELPDRDLGEELHATFVEQGAAGSTFTFATFEAVAKEILRLRAELLDARGGWDGPTDTGVPEQMTAEVNTALAAIERVQEQLESADQPAPPAGVSNERD